MKQQSKTILTAFFVMIILIVMGVYGLNTEDIDDSNIVVKEIAPSSVSIKEGSDKEIAIVDVVARNYSFSVETIRLKKGQRVRLNFKSEEGFHNFIVDEFDVETTTLSSGDTEVIEFIANKAGKFYFYCSVGNHRQLGMEGKIIVE